MAITYPVVRRLPISLTGETGTNLYCDRLPSDAGQYHPGSSGLLTGTDVTAPMAQSKPLLQQTQ